MKRTRYSRVVGVVIALIAVFALNLIITPRSTAETASGLSWSDPIQPSIKLQQTLTQDEYLELTGQTNFPCKSEIVYRGVPHPAGGQRPPIDSPLPGCTIAGLSGKYDSSNQAVIPYGSTRNQALADPSLSRTFYFGVQGTNKVAVLSNAYQLFYGGTPTLHIANDWTSTFANFSADQNGNVTRSRSQPYDFVLKDSAGNPVDVRPNGLSFSANGRWLHAGVTNVSQVAIDLQTHEVIPFAPYAGMDYAVYSKVSNDGRYVAFSKPYGGLKIYDLTKCQPAAGEFTSRDCEYRDVFEILRTHISTNDLRVRNLDFIGADNALDVTVDFQNADGSWGYGVYRMYLPNTTSDKYLALGDSFSSGEGAYDYRDGTDIFKSENEYNLCHQSKNSYPYLLQNSLQFSRFNSVACSGAKQKDIKYPSSEDPIEYLRSVDAQASSLLDDQLQMNSAIDSISPGYVPQGIILETHSPSLATISIGGNDIGFGRIIASCIVNKGLNQFCFWDRKERELLANNIDQKISELAVNFRDIKASLSGSDPRLYVIGYPQIINPDHGCDFNVPLLQDERYAAVALTNYLNAAIKVAANAAGVRYVNMTNALIDGDKDYRLCSDQPQLAVNGLILSGKSANKPGEVYYHESFHPNQLGQSLMANTIRSQTADMTLGMPEVKDTTDSLVQFRKLFVGDSDITLQNHRITYDKDIAPALVVKGQSIQVSQTKDAEGLPAQLGSQAVVEIHSTPRQLGQLPIAADGSISGSVTIPSDIETGYHELHVLYTDIEGKTEDKYTYIYVAQTSEDWDGDGMNNASDLCSIVLQSNFDKDEDGIDDACDNEYIKTARSPSESTTPSRDAQSPQQTRNSSISSATVSDTDAVLSAQTHSPEPAFVFGDNTVGISKSDTTETDSATPDQTHIKDELPYLLLLTVGIVSISSVGFLWYLRKRG